MKTIRVPALTGLRFVAAMMVLIGHGWSVLHFTGDTITGRILNPLPSMGMTLFFVLSGFVMWVNYAESFRERFWLSLWHFGVARFARLYPLYAVVLLFALIVTSWPALRGELPDALLFIPLLQAWVPGSIPVSATFSIPQLAHAWSISVEMFLYLCFPAIALILISITSRRTLFRLGLANFVICGIGIWFYVRHIPQLAAHLAPGMPVDAANMWIGYYSPLTRVTEFVAGCIVGSMIGQETNEEPGWHLLGLILCLVALATTAALYSVPLPQAPQTVILRVLPLASFAYLIWFLARFKSAIGRLLSTSTVVGGGEISYSIYLLHPFILPWFLKPEMSFTPTHFGLWLAVMAMASGTVIVMSYGTWSLIEVPARRWLREALAPQRDELIERQIQASAAE